MQLTRPGIVKITEAIVPLLNRMQIFTVSGTFTAPKTGDYFVICIGGGGGGGGGGGPDSTGVHGGSGGGGGGGGTIAFDVVSLTASDSISVTVGATASGGTGGMTDASGTAGTTGNPSLFGSFITAGGGYAGHRGINTLSRNKFGLPGVHGGGFGGGQPGDWATVNGYNGLNGLAGAGRGAGGGGGGGSTAGASHGGNGGIGGPGIVIVLW